MLVSRHQNSSYELPRPSAVALSSSKMMCPVHEVGAVSNAQGGANTLLGEQDGRFSFLDKGGKRLLDSFPDWTEEARQSGRRASRRDNVGGIDTRLGCLSDWADRPRSRLEYHPRRR